MRDNRQAYIDFLRIVSVFFVIMSHSAGTERLFFNEGSSSWVIINIYYLIARFSLPMFAMISGALFLDSDYDYDAKKMYTHHILRMVLAFIFWSLIYAVLHTIDDGFFDSAIFIRRLVSGEYHMWFIIMITGFYVLLPVLRVFTAGEKTNQKSMAIMIVLTFAICIMLFCLLRVTKPTLLSRWTANSLFAFTLGFPVYFISGCYLKKYWLSKKAETLVYSLAVLTFIISVSLLFSEKGIDIINKTGKLILSPFSPYAFFASVSIFILAKKFCMNKQFIPPKILVKSSYGMYLSHVLILAALEHIGCNITVLPVIISVPLITVAAYFLSLIFVMLLLRIPLLNKYFI